MLLGWKVTGHWEGLGLEGALQAVGLTAEAPPFVAAALELVLDNNREGRSLGLRLWLLLLSVAGTRLLRSVRGGRASVRVPLGAQIPKSAAAVGVHGVSSALLHFCQGHSGDAHYLCDHVEQSLGAARRPLRCLHIETAGVGE